MLILVGIVVVSRNGLLVPHGQHTAETGADSSEQNERSETGGNDPQGQISVGIPQYGTAGGVDDVGAVRTNHGGTCHIETKCRETNDRTGDGESYGTKVEPVVTVETLSMEGLWFSDARCGCTSRCGGGCSGGTSFSL